MVAFAESTIGTFDPIVPTRGDMSPDEFGGLWQDRMRHVGTSCSLPAIVYEDFLLLVMGCQQVRTLVLPLVETLTINQVASIEERATAAANVAPWWVFNLSGEFARGELEVRSKLRDSDRWEWTKPRLSVLAVTLRCVWDVGDQVIEPIRRDGGQGQQHGTCVSRSYEACRRVMERYAGNECVKPWEPYRR